MKFNPIAKTLFTDDSIFIKKLYCPYGIVWDDLSKDDGNSRNCELCEKRIFEIDNFSDEDVIVLVANDPDICLKIDFDSSNIRIINNGM